MIMTPILMPGFLYYSTNTNIRVLWTFSGSNGSNPVLAPIQVGGLLYGVTTEGGFFNTSSARSYGALYSINKNGTNYQLPHSFFGGVGPLYPDGDNNCGVPGQFSGYLISTGSLIIGTTYTGGPSTDFAQAHATTDCGGGAIFFYNTSNSSYNVTFPFISSSVYGNQPNSLIIYNNKIYGSAFYGGQGWGNFSTQGNGTIWSTDINGNNQNIVYPFISSSIAGPTGFIQSGSSNMLYGSWLSSDGGIFSFDMNSNIFSELHTFSGGSDGSFPYIPPIVSGSTLYGGATNAGVTGSGVLYSINTDGTGFSVIYNFGSTSAVNPSSNLYIIGNTIYGLSAGGAFNNGTIYSVNKNGTNFKILYNFTGSNDGQLSYNTFTVFDNVLYCTATYGGTYNEGTIFAYYL